MKIDGCFSRNMPIPQRAVADATAHFFDETYKIYTLKNMRLIFICNCVTIRFMAEVNVDTA